MKSGKLNIVMVSGHACIRVQKMALPLLNLGHDVHLIAKKMPSYWEQYTSVSIYNDTRQLVELVKLHDRAGADVFHCHNEPSYFVTVCKEQVRSKKPVVLDVHDSYLNRSTPEQEAEAREAGRRHVRTTVEERTNFQLADALVFVSYPMAEAVRSEFGLEQPHLVLPSYVPKQLYRYSFKEWLGGLVYEGKVVLPEEVKPPATGFEYADYLEFAKQADAAGLNFHLYPAREDKAFVDAYGPHTIIHPPMSYEPLMSALTRHDWGLVGNLTPTPQWEIAAPNKLFEYIAAGVPVVAMNAAVCSNFLELTGMGITIHSVEELTRRWDEHRERRKYVIKHRQSWTMDGRVDRLIHLYREVM